jgi:hypothetical protein
VPNSSSPPADLWSSDEEDAEDDLNVEAVRNSLKEVKGRRD